jgi:hypothetical protein
MVMNHKEGLGPKIDLELLKKIVGKSITSHLPPAGFDPLAASEEELLKLGFPKRPNPRLQPAEHAFWREMFASPVQFEAFSFDILPLLTTQSRGFFGQLPRRQTSFNWSGAYITPRDSTIFSSIRGKWQVPTPNLPPGGVAGQKYRSSTWIGFDGQRRYYRSTLPQIGTTQSIEPATSTQKPFFAWWQWWVRDVAGQAFPIQLIRPAIHAGDLVMSFMQVANDRSIVSFAITNLTTGRAVQFSQGAPPDNWGQPFKVSGATAEWVMERPADAPNPAPLPLPDYGTVDFHDCGAVAINTKTGATVERSLSAARLIDMYIVKQNPERIAKISIATPLDKTEFLTHFR